MLASCPAWRAPLVPPGLAVLVGLSLGSWSPGSGAVWWLAGLACLVLSLGLTDRPRSLAALLAFAFLGFGRAAGDTAAPALPADEVDRLYLLEFDGFGRRHPGVVESPAIVTGAWRGGLESRNGDFDWVQQVRASVLLRAPAWPNGQPPQWGDRWLVRGRVVSPCLGKRGPPVLRVRRSERLVPLSAGPETPRSLLRWLAPHRLAARGWIARHLDRWIPGPGNGLLHALVLGDRSRLPSRLRDQFVRTGTVHLLAISGLHVGLCAWTLGGLARVALRRLPRDWLPRRGSSGVTERVSVMAGLAGAAAYVFLAGAPVSSRRALWMLAFLVLGQMLDRPSSAWNGLAAAALGLAWCDPGLVVDLGYQLSLASVAGLLVIGAGWSPFRTGGGLAWVLGRRAVRWVLGLVLGSLATALATAPICAATWGVVPVAGLWSNPLVVPVLALLTVPLVVGGLLVQALVPPLGAPLLLLASETAELGLGLVAWAAAPSRCPLWAVALPPWATAIPLVLVSTWVAFGHWREE